jgi:uncharacterized protein
MKYLIWLLVILLAIWVFKRSRRDEADTPAKKQPLAAPANMLTCRHCGIHLPQDEAVAGEQGPYCSTEHRTAAQDRHPAD